MTLIKFADYKKQVGEALEVKVKLLPEDTDGYSIVEGFFIQQIQEEIGDAYMIGGGTVLPTVAVVGNSSGLVYHFALKSILPDLDIYNDK